MDGLIYYDVLFVLIIALTGGTILLGIVFTLFLDKKFKFTIPKLFRRVNNG